MSAEETTARARELGAELRRLRKKSGYSSVELAKKLGWVPSTVTRVETGVRAVTETNLVHFAATAGATPLQLKHLQAMWGEGRGQGYWLTDRFSAMLFQESTALSTVAYQPVVVPGLLQTRAYAESLNRAHGVTGDESNAEPPDTADGVGLTFTRQVAGGGRDLENSVASGFVS